MTLLTSPGPETVEGAPPDEIVYRLLPQASQRGKPKLVDTAGYTYTSQEGAKVLPWHCSKGPKCCPATVKMIDGEHWPMKTHTHEPDPGADMASIIGEEARKAGCMLGCPTTGIGEAERIT